MSTATLGLLVYSSDASSIRSSNNHGDTKDVTSISNRNSTEVVSAVESRSRTKPLKDRARPEKKLGSKQQRHRAHAYETLTGSSQESKEKSRDSHRQRRHPSSLRPGSAASTPMNATSKHDSAELRETRPTSSNWKFQKPAYVQYTSDLDHKSDSGSSVPPLSRYDAYRPLPPLPPQEHEYKPRGRSRKARPPTLNIYGAPMREDSDIELSNHSNSTYSFPPFSADPVSRSDVQSSRTTERVEHHRNHNSRSANSHTVRLSSQAYNPSTNESNGTKQQVVNHSVSSPSSPSYYTYSIPAVPVPSPSADRHSRSPSPAWGAWRADKPKQDRPSVAVRAREHMQKNLKLVTRLRRSSFTVRNVIKSPTIAAELELNWPTTGPADTQIPSATEQGNRRSMSFSQSDVAAELEALSLSPAELEDTSYQRRQERSSSTPAQETRARTVRSRATEVRQPRDELFLDTLDNPGGHTFFSSEWSRQERILLEQEKEGSYFVPLPIRGEPQSVALPHFVNEVDRWSAETTGQILRARYSGDTVDDRRSLPSQSDKRSFSQSWSLPSSPPLCETPERMPSLAQQSIASRSSRKGARYI
ncbi:hypothetical protein F4818DRAFT_384631 [Hypoxylon cercidicola]|nr:hypothetical protein F4818DRAFT_384631 [Hypoxylon cercidicola]